MNNELKAKQNWLAAQTAEISQKIIAATDEYISGFDRNDLFTLSSKKDQAKKYTEKYYLFLSGISSYISQLTDLNAELASLLITADRAMETDIVILCEKRFDAFTAFEHALYDYTSSVDKELLASTVTAVFLINSAQKFKNATNNLIKASL